MWTYEHDSNVHWDGEEELYWEYFTINDEDGNEVARCDDEKMARFITTTPELLEALQRFYNWYDALYGDDLNYTGEHPIAVAKAAIAKALGETK